MARLRISAAGAIKMAAAGVLLLPALSSCHGRTLDNVEPTGETVEVEIDTLLRPQHPEVDTLLVQAGVSAGTIGIPESAVSAES